MQKKIFIYLLILCQNLYFSQSIKGFRIPDSLRNKNIKQIESSFKKYLYIDNAKAEVYANTALVEGKRDRNNEKMAEGYQMLYQLNNNRSTLLYLDSMITVSKKIQNTEYLSKAYRNKGVYYYYAADYSKSLDNYLIAKSYTKKGSEIYYNINSCIGLLKLELEDYPEALKLLLSYKQFLEKNNLTDDINYEKCLYNLAYTYHVNNKVDSSNYYVKRGFEQNLKSKDRDLYASLSLISGINTFKQGNYNSALPILVEASKIFKENPNNVQNIALVEYYIGKILYHANDEKFLNRFERVDSIITKTKNVSYELRNTYPILIEYYKKTGNKEKQLFYIEHLLSVDSILSKNNKLLTTEINKRYDTPLLLKEKEMLISDLNSKNYTLFWILGITGGIMIYLVYLYRENRRKLKNYQNKADLLTEDPVVPDSIEPIDIQKEKPKITLSNDKLEQLSRQLNEFEVEKKFLDKKINLDLLSKEFNTNRAYLSRSVNELKGQNFSQYLNALRIQYIVHELKTNKNLQKLTIAAIADEAGYNNVESFTNAFKKITDTLPSYFIKALQENNK
jgi:AraC-like DNA-binding protein